MSHFSLSNNNEMNWKQPSQHIHTPRVYQTYIKPSIIPISRLQIYISRYQDHASSRLENVRVSTIRGLTNLLCKYKITSCWQLSKKGMFRSRSDRLIVLYLSHGVTSVDFERVILVSMYRDLAHLTSHGHPGPGFMQARSDICLAFDMEGSSQIQG
jgi:hypothetical protein